MSQTPGLGGPARPETYRVARNRKKDADWHEASLTLVARVPARTRDEKTQAWTFTNWSGLATSLERTLTSQRR
jgi:hypothetical protein